MVALVAAWACMGEDLTRPPDGVPEAPLADRPQAGGSPVGRDAARPLTVTLTAPAASPAASVMLWVEGPAIDSVRAPGLTLFAAGAPAPGGRRLVVAGDLSAGPVLEIWVPAGSDPAGYRAELLEVAGEDYSLQDLGRYSATVAR